MFYLKRDEVADKENIKMERIMRDVLKNKKIKESELLNLIGKQRNELNVDSEYYSGNIAEGNWCLLKNDIDIKILDKDKRKAKIDALDILLGLEKDEKDIKMRENDAEYEYVFKPSFYAVISLIYYYLNNKKEAEKIFNLKTAVLRRRNTESTEYYGGLPFILRYLKIILSKDSEDHIVTKFVDIMDTLSDCKRIMKINDVDDEFLNDIIDCIKKSGCKDFILIKRVKDLEYEKDKYFHIEYKIDDYDILMHRDVKKDWKYLNEAYVKEAKEKIIKTPKHPFNDSEKDSEKLKRELKGWFSQRIGIKDRLVYKKDANNKVVYIATVCDHYKDAEGRTKSVIAYR
mgnify:CR=1 FL=1